jgi:NADH-quinone oxidoreductase subunit L
LGSRYASILILIPLLPLLGFLLNGFLGKWGGKGFVRFVGTAAPLTAFTIALAFFAALLWVGSGSVVTGIASSKARLEVIEALKKASLEPKETPEDRARGELRVLADKEDVKRALGGVPVVQVRSWEDHGPFSWYGPAMAGEQPGIYQDVPWISISGPKGFDVSFRFVFDRLSGILCLVVLGVGSLIHIYSRGYMAGENAGGFARYFAYLNLFTGMMLILILAGDLLLMFVGWEGVGLASYLLIGFEYKEGWKADAGIKAFVVNRVGDFGFMLGVLGLALCAIQAGNRNLRIDRLVGPDGLVTSVSAETPLDETATYTARLHDGEIVQGKAHEKGESALVVETKTGNVEVKKSELVSLWKSKIAPFTLGMAALCLLLGATGKSAQLPLYVWLPDAMAGPTPVSALIHAATMVTAGVYMVCRLHPIFDAAVVPGTGISALAVVALVGTATSFLAATIALAQDDIKKVLAYSTVSQLGYMFVGCGVGAYGAAIFHLVTHAFFKALLFLGAGSVIHGTGTQDMRKMGGLSEKMPATYWTMTVGAAALAGLPLMSGFFSKDMILGSALERASMGGGAWWGVYLVGMAGAFITAFYSTRLIALTFWNKQGEASEHAHESPDVMTVPLTILAALSILGGLLGLPALFGSAGEFMPHWLSPLLAPHGVEAEAGGHGLEAAALGISSVVAIFAVFLSYKMYVDVPASPAWESKPIRAFLAGAWGIDAAYRRFIVEPVMSFAHGLWEVVDAAILDRGFVDGFGRLARGAGELASSLETGRVARYAAYVAVGAVVVIAAAVVRF